MPSSETSEEAERGVQANILAQSKNEGELPGLPPQGRDGLAVMLFTPSGAKRVPQVRVLVAVDSTDQGSHGVAGLLAGSGSVRAVFPFCAQECRSSYCVMWRFSSLTRSRHRWTASTAMLRLLMTDVQPQKQYRIDGDGDEQMQVIGLSIRKGNAAMRTRPGGHQQGLEHGGVRPS